MKKFIIKILVLVVPELPDIPHGFINDPNGFYQVFMPFPSYNLPL